MLMRRWQPQSLKMESEGDKTPRDPTKVPDTIEKSRSNMRNATSGVDMQHRDRQLVVGSQRKAHM